MSIPMNAAKQAIHDKIEPQIKTAQAKLETLKAKAESAKANAELKLIAGRWAGALQYWHRWCRRC